MWDVYMLLAIMGNRDIAHAMLFKACNVIQNLRVSCLYKRNGKLDPQQLRVSLFSALYVLVQKYPTPINLSYAWNFGIYAFVALIAQILTGIFLVMHYTPEVDLAFSSVEHIMRDVPFGWFKILSFNGASIFFIVVIYVHIVRGLFLVLT